MKSAPSQLTFMSHKSKFLECDSNKNYGSITSAITSCKDEANTQELQGTEYTIWNRIRAATSPTQQLVTEYTRCYPNTPLGNQIRWTGTEYGFACFSSNACNRIRRLRTEYGFSVLRLLQLRKVLFFINHFLSSMRESSLLNACVKQKA
ncbi:uncharacterized protein HKW66_Vig0147560 [Vigna angularis]|uniref:Uncharacterized protein n=1 Tax=Phaseolus angularis TaxID=3914 RepID=A0A8T0JXX8_PHAAN|nr:uncharacterized protein HKW66_Vig0147560 [Vigna angularis]